MNALERAVIEAARAFCAGVGPGSLTEVAAKDQLYARVKALELHEKAMATGDIREIDWSLVAVGDEVQGKSGTFYPVTATRATVGYSYQITIRMAQGERTITRPSESQPMATVRRGQDGAAVDVLVNVFTSGDSS